MTTRSLPNVETIFRAGAPMIMITGGGLKVLTADDARTLAAMLTEAANRVEHHENYGDPMTLGNIYPSDIEKAAAAPTATAQLPRKMRRKDQSSDEFLRLRRAVNTFQRWHPALHGPRHAPAASH